MLVPGNGCLMRQCRNCGLWVNISPPIEDVAAHYGTEYHEQQYGRHGRRKLATARLIVRQVSALCRPGALLDIGCSLGYVLRAAQDAGWEAWGIDVSEDVIRQCREQGLQAKTAGMGQLPFADETFDVVLARHVLEHDLQVRRNLAEMRRVLKPQGLLLLEVPDCSSRKVLRRGASYTKFWTRDHVIGFTPATLAAYVAAAGLHPQPQAPFSGLWGRPLADLPGFFCWSLARLLARVSGAGKTHFSAWRKEGSTATD